MSKELFVASSPHETKVAVLEDDELVEVFYQRDTDDGLVGGIYKGRVSRVLPGMQSAFVDIGLERDAFLYVSDFFEDSEEYERVVADAETRVGKYIPAPAPPPDAEALSGVEPARSGPGELVGGTTAPAPEAAAAPPPVLAAPGGAQPATPSPSPPAGAPEAGFAYRRQEPRGRRRRRRGGRGFGAKPEFRDDRPAQTGFAVLPGETLAKHGHVSTEGQALAATPEAAVVSEVTTEVPLTDFQAHATAVEIGAAEERPEYAAGAKVPAQGLNTEQSAVASAGPEARVTEAASSATFAGPLSEPSEPLSGWEATAEEGLEAELLDGNLRVAPVDFEPDAPAHLLAGPSASGPVSAAELTSASETPEAEASNLGRALGVGTTAEQSVAAEASASAEPMPLAGTGSPAAVSPVTEVGESSHDRAYTLRESQQRPRFAPRRGRRGRGRFGQRTPHPEGPMRRYNYPRGGNDQPVQINQVLKEGREILVQIAKEPLGTKGARITSHIALPGRYLVYMPTIHHIGVSRRIASEEERLRLRNIVLENRGPLAGGIIARTAAAGRLEEELKADLQFLSTLWNDIRTRAEQAKAPALIHHDLTLIERILRDILSPDFKCVRVDNDIEYQNILEFVHRFQPSLVGHVRLHTKDTSLFEEFGIQAEIDKALKPKVWLKSGGYIVINQTEALVAIDVNTGKYVGKTNRLEDTIVKTNIDAVKEIVRQIRLRDLGGIIVIDFIDMDDRRNRLKVVQALEEALRSDRAPTKILSFNEFGLVALTRKRVKHSLERTLSEPCPYCTGSGWVKSVTTVCYEIMEEARKMAHEIEGKEVTLRVNPEVARALKSRDGILTSQLESLTGKDVVIKSDPAVHQERYEIF